MTIDAPPPCADQWYLFDSGDRQDHQRAKAICATCPLFDACHETPIPPNFQGTWAGVGYGIHTIANHKTRPHTHGTVAGYRKHARLNELPCDDCWAAHSEYQKARGREQRRKEKAA